MLKSGLPSSKIRSFNEYLSEQDVRNQTTTTKSIAANISQQHDGSIANEKSNEIADRETYITSSSVTTSCSSSAEEMNQTKKQKQPVATDVTSPTFSPAIKKSTASVTIATPSAETSASETSTGMSFLRNNFPFFRNTTSRSRSQSVVSDISRSSETGDSRKERDKSYRRKSHLNRAFTDEPVPANNFAYDIESKSSKSTSHDASSLENSALEESRIKPAVKLHPAIPSVLTATNGESSSVKLNHIPESTPSPVPTNPTMGKVQTTEQNRKGSPVVKKDSFSDAEGVSFIKKMLQKEGDRDRAAAAAAGGNKSNSHNTSVGNNSSMGYNLKKSPSAGNQSYWSKFSSSQPAFLRKLFEKPKPSEPSSNLKSSQNSNEASQSVENSEKDSEKENAEPVMGFSVAQKASFFMKLEHEQRFSKWRKNSVDLGSIPSSGLISEQSRSLHGNGNQKVTGSSREFKTRSRHMTQPVTPTEVKEIAPLLNFTSRNLDGRNLEFGSEPKIWGNSFSSLGNCVDNPRDNIKIEDMSEAPVPKSSYKECDDTHKFEPIIVGSLKERVNKFDEIVTRKIEPIKCSAEPTTVKSYSLTRSGRHNTNTQNNLGGFPMYHSASAIINPTVPKNSILNIKSNNFCKNSATAFSSSSSSFSEAASRNNSTKFLPVTANCIRTNGSPLYETNNKRRGSASDLEFSDTVNLPSTVLPRTEKVKSMYISPNRYHCDAENLSEDGEVSSGGQEVAEIICRSYENSPVFRKKNWRAQKQVQQNFTKEIWRRCGTYENWNQRSQTNPPHQSKPQHPIPQTFTATTNVIEVTTAPPNLPSLAPSPPRTSNLLQILTVLSSSNDELNEPKSTPKKRQGHKQICSRSDSIPPIHPGHQNHCTNLESKHNTASKSVMSPAPVGPEVYVSVPHPEDEAFQSFFCSVKSYTQVTHYPQAVVTTCLDNNGQLQHNYSSSSSNINGDMAQQSNAGGDLPFESNDALDIGSVRRESDLLVMKKNIPTAKRKSNGKYKNPLRALAARMDFRQQGYTQINNTVQYSSDVDVTT